MKIADIPRHERPREKLLGAGPNALSDAELLAIFLRTGVKGKSAIALARTLLDEFGDISKLLNAELKEFTRIPGLGEVKYVQIQAAKELVSRHLATKLRFETTVVDIEHVKDYLALKLCHQPSEVFACLFLDSRNHVLSYDELFYGTINHATVHPREVVRYSIKHNASSIILAHNHPSGVAKPSNSDIEITKQIKAALELIDVRLLDHIIVGKGNTYSFSEWGLV